MIETKISCYPDVSFSTEGEGKNFFLNGYYAVKKRIRFGSNFKEEEVEEETLN